jgi:hypothetical protein
MQDSFNAHWVQFNKVLFNAVLLSESFCLSSKSHLCPVSASLYAFLTGEACGLYKASRIVHESLQT